MHAIYNLLVITYIYTTISLSISFYDEFELCIMRILPPPSPVFCILYYHDRCAAIIQHYCVHVMVYFLLLPNNRMIVNTHFK